MSDQGNSGPSEFNPKHRIMGAVVLVALAVIFVPMILERPKGPETAPTPAMEIPDKDKKIFVSKIKPITPEEQGAAPSTPASDPGAQAPSDAGPTAPAPSKPKQETPPPKAAAPAEPAKQAPVKTAKPAAATAVPPAEEGWVVRVGTFSQGENAERIKATLERKGFEPDSGEVDVGGRSVTRVWVGPFETREEAAEVRSRILKETGQEGLIVAYP
jgi:DedD protein